MPSPDWLPPPPCVKGLNWPNMLPRNLQSGWVNHQMLSCRNSLPSVGGSENKARSGGTLKRHSKHTQGMVIRARGQVVVRRATRSLLLLASPPAQAPHCRSMPFKLRRVPDQLVPVKGWLLLLLGLGIGRAAGISNQLQQLQSATLQAGSQVVAGAWPADRGKLHAAHTVAALDGRNRRRRQRCCWGAAVAAGLAGRCCARSAQPPHLDCNRGRAGREEGRQAGMT